MTNKTHYQAYLIRFQRGAGESHWRVTLQNVESAETLRFATERELIRYLLKALNVAPNSDEADAGSTSDSAT